VGTSKMKMANLHKIRKKITVRGQNSTALHDKMMAAMAEKAFAAKRIRFRR
jgi:hypothetical protein